MRRRKFIAAVGGAAIAGPIAAATQQPVGVPRIGLLMGADPREEATKLDAFRGALAKTRLHRRPDRRHRGALCNGAARRADIIRGGMCISGMYDLNPVRLSAAAAMSRSMTPL